jgi:hypothetical protein
MPYRIRFRRRAKAEFTQAQGYSTQFGDELSRWLNDIAIAVDPGEKELSADLTVILESCIDLIPEAESPWKASWVRWKRAGNLEKLRAVIALVKTHRPPWELHATSRWFPQILNAFDCEAHTIFEVNHVDREVVFTKFAGLPGQDH